MFNVKCILFFKAVALYSLLCLYASAVTLAILNDMTISCN